MEVYNKDKILLLESMMSLLGHKNALQWKRKRKKDDAENKRKYIDQLEREIAEDERVARIWEKEWMDTNEAIAKLIEPLSLDDTVELMTYLSSQNEDAYDEAVVTHRPNNIIAQLLFNGKL